MSASGGRRIGVQVVFFFQAEDGIRDDLVTGVQTCALPIAAVSKHSSRGARKAAKKEEQAKAKEEKEFRKKVEKEKIAMAAREELEKEKTLAELEENKSIGSDDIDKTLASPTQT